MDCRLIRSIAALAVVAALIAGCAAPAGYANDPGFAVRMPQPRQPGYLQTIKYIDDGLRAVDAEAAFFVSPEGGMCFRGVLYAEQTSFDFIHNTDWCLPPAALGQVAMVPSSITGKDDLQLACAHASPQCMHEMGAGGRTANVITVHAVPPPEEKAAIEHVAYLMGSAIGDTWPVR